MNGGENHAGENPNMRRRLVIGGAIGLAAGGILGFPLAAYVGLEVFYRNFGTPGEVGADPAGYSVWGSCMFLGTALGLGIAYLVPAERRDELDRRPP